MADNLKPYAGKHTGAELDQSVDRSITNRQQIDTIETTLNNKANTSDVTQQINQVNEAIAAKANTTDLQETNAAVGLKANISDLNTAKTSLQNQINSIVAPVTEDAEVINARTGTDGGQYTTLKQRLDTENETINGTLDDAVNTGEVNMFDYRTVMYEVFLNSTTGAEESNVNYNASPAIPVVPGDDYTFKTFSYTGDPSYRIYQYKADNSLIKRTTGKCSDNPNGYVFEAPENCAYFRLNFESDKNSGGTQDVKTFVMVHGATKLDTYYPHFIANDTISRKNVDLVQKSINARSETLNFQNADNWEIGGIKIESSGWTYGENPNRIRTKSSFTIPIQRGDVIKLTDYTDAKFNVGIHKPDGTYGYTGYRTEDYISTTDGDAVIVVANLTDKPQSNVYDLLNLVVVKRNSTNKSPNSKPILTIIDDDTLSIEHVTKFYNACNANGIVGTFASEMQYVETTAGLKELLQSYEDKGFEVAFHCNIQTEIYRSDDQHRDFDDMQEDFTQGLRKYRQWFIPGACWVTPYGSHDADIQGLAKKRGFDGLVSIAQATYERVGIYSGRYFIPRVGLNQTDGEGSVTLAQLKDIMRECADNNGWLLIGTHFNNWDDNVGYSRFNEVVDLAKELDFDIMTLTQAFKTWEPLYDERDHDVIM